MNIESSLYSISLAPKLASEIKKYTEHKDPITGERKIDYVSNTVAHAILGAVVAELQGNSALAGGLGAAYGERSAEIIAKILYPDKAIDKLSQEEKQQVSALAQLAAGLTTAALGGDAQDINTAMAGGKNALENNIFTYAGDNSESIQFQTGVVQVLETESQIYYECKGDADCIAKKELEAGLISRDRLSDEVKKKLRSLAYNTPFAGLVYGVSDSINEGDITPTLEATLAQARLSWILYLSGQLEKPLIIDKMIETSTEGRKTSGRSTQYERSGGISQANLDFDSLKPTNIKNIDEGRMGTLPDGRTIIVRTKSTDGRPTIEIQKKSESGKVISATKFRYDKWE